MNRFLTEEDVQMANKHEKLLTIMSLGNCKLKQQWNTSTHLLECLKSKKKKKMTPNAVEDVEQQELSFIAGGSTK